MRFYKLPDDTLINLDHIITIGPLIERGDDEYLWIIEMAHHSFRIKNEELSRDDFLEIMFPPEPEPVRRPARK